MEPRILVTCTVLLSRVSLYVAVCISSLYLLSIKCILYI